MTGFRSFDNGTRDRVLRLLEAGYLRLGKENYVNPVWSERWRCQW